MAVILHRWLFVFLVLCAYFPALSAIELQLISTESDPDAFIQNSVNVITGDYCESATDMAIQGPDTLLLQRFYSTKDPIRGTEVGSWRMLPERFLVIGKTSGFKPCTIGKDRFEWSTAFIGERSGGTLPYSGWRSGSGMTKDPFKIDVFNNTLGMVNTYAKEINGQTNHQNNLLYCKGDTCEQILGDGTKRIYQKVHTISAGLFGEELVPLMAAQVTEPEYFLLAQQVLPSGNQLFFSYDTDGHLISIEMKNKTGKKTLSWIRLNYNFQKSGCLVHMTTSDVKTVTYHFILKNDRYQLTKVEGSHLIPVSYDYQEVLIKKTLPEGRFTEIEYLDGKVKSVKGPHPSTGKAESIYSFSYGKDYTDVFDAVGTKTRYLYDKRLQLTALERYDDQNNLYRVEQKFWGKTKADAGLLVARTTGDGGGHILSYRSFQYDKSGNVIEEKLYGNLTGKQEIHLKISSDGKLIDCPSGEECHTKTFGYSTDGFNLLTKIGDSKGNQTLYTYKTGTNLLVKKFIFDKGHVQKRVFQTYNDDAVCVRVVEDDGSEENEKEITIGWGITERHIKEIKPKETLPGVGLPEIIEEKALDLKKGKEVLIRKLVNTYDDQSHLLSCSTYDANGQYAFIESKTYSVLGQVASLTDAAGRKVCYTYDPNGNQVSISFPLESRSVATVYDRCNQPVETIEITAEGQFTTSNCYDILGRKISSTDRFGNSTFYEYDVFHRLKKVSHPEVFNENNQVIRPIFTYTYDLFGNALTIQDPKGHITTKSYNLRGAPTKIAYPDGSHELFKYDPEGSLHRSMSREQIITVYEYDYLGRDIYEESSTANTGTNASAASSFLGSKMNQYNGFHCTFKKEDNYNRRYYYDFAGRISSFSEYDYEKGEKSPETRTTDIIYDSLGRIHQKKVWFDTGAQDYGLECFEYDFVGNVLEKRIQDANGSILVRKGFIYNSQGQCIEEYGFENGNKVSLLKTSYNSQGEAISYRDALGQETKILIDASYRNALGQRVLKKTLINPAGIQTEMEFDALGRVYAISRKDAAGVLLSSQKMLYDALGNTSCELHDQIINGKILSSTTTRSNYGPMGRLEEEIEAKDSPLEKRISYSYNSLGQMTNKAIQGTIASINYIYERGGKLHKIEANDNQKKTQILNTYLRNWNGDITAAYSQGEKFIERTYNCFHQVIKEIIKNSEGSYTLQYAYDRKGRIKEIILPDTSKIVYSYDALFGREVKRISAQGEVLYTHLYDQYDEQGRLQIETHVGYIGSQEYTYDLNGQKIATKSDLFNEEYTRDILGRLVKITGENQEEYSYNGLSQLVSEKKGTAKTYAYDSVDNRIQVDNETLLYNALNQLISNSKAQFSYDPQGNLSKKILDGEETNFENNVLSQLTSIENADKTSLLFSYDPLGRLLVKKHVDTKDKNKKTLSATSYFYLGHQELGSLTTKGAIETLKVPGIAGGELALTSVAFELKGEMYVPIHDISGNVIQLLDPRTRQQVEKYSYTAFGKEAIFNSYGEVQEVSPVGNPWRFAEKRVDEETGLIFFGLRFYDPSIGRWISQDPAGFIDGCNLYAYVHNSPVNHKDRFGLATESLFFDKVDNGYFYGEVETHCFCEKHRTCKRGGDIGKTATSSLPKIAYNTEFEDQNTQYESQFRPEYDHSRLYSLSDQGLPELPNMEIGFINGIDNTYTEARHSAIYISRLAGGYNVHAVYNATHGRTTDAKECWKGLRYIATDPVRQLHKMWNSFFEKSSANTKFLMICHSQGAIHVRNALLDYPPELRARILVVAVAPGGYIYQESCAQVVHFRAHVNRDPVPYIDQGGIGRSRKTIVELDSHPDAPWLDHPFESPTYQKKLTDRIDVYKESNGRNI